MTSQRDTMKKLWNEFSGDQDLVIQEYARLELVGRVSRKSNASAMPAVEYARRLLKDGLAKGWLDSGTTKTSKPLAYSPVKEPDRNYKIPVSEFSSNEIPKDKMQWIHSWFEKTGIPSESAEYLKRIAAWRAVWKPARVRILLVAESHVAEQAGDLDVQVIPPKILIPELSLPRGFCRLVYCLGYGEDEICYPGKLENNSGTRQFWDLFGAISAGLNPAITAKMSRKSESTLNYRIQWKIAVLKELGKAGIWLEDASVIGLYPNVKKHLSNTGYCKVIRESFESFVWPEIEKDNPEQVWVIGRGVGNALKGLPMIFPEHVISQPQTRKTYVYNEELKNLVHKVKSLA